MKDQVTVFLPSAGLSERLRPITEQIPKPLLPILGKPLMEIILERVARVCSGRIGVNLHYKPEMIREWFGNSPYDDRVTFFYEKSLLGTGGALNNAGDFLSSGPFLVHNADILLDIDFSNLVHEHISSGNIATLVTHRHPELSNVVVDDNDCVIDVENPGMSMPDSSRIARKVAYTGVAVYSPEILRYLPEGVSHATVAWLAAVADGYKVKVYDCTGSFWSDIGTPQTYAAAIVDTLAAGGESVYCSSFAQCGEIQADGYIVLESDCRVEDGAHLRNCIVMTGAYVLGQHNNRIIGPGYTIDLSEEEMQPSLRSSGRKRVSFSDPLLSKYYASDLMSKEGGDTADAVLVGTGGSDRRYYRIKRGEDSAVLMECGQDDPDYERHIEYTHFLKTMGFPVPELFSVDSASKRALFEDLGDLSLYSFLRLPHKKQVVEEVYRKIIEIAADLHTRVSRHVNKCDLRAERLFDYDHLRWETNYFLKQYMSGLRGISVKDPEALEKEFHRLALWVDAFPKTIIHRDLQCQNIMLKRGEPRIIDYQGARFGPPAYDIASLLWDPYHRIDNEMRERLVVFYVDNIVGNVVYSPPEFHSSLILCRLQRHMQALGAYAYLSKVKGKTYFLKHIPEGLRLLKEDVTLLKEDFPALYEVIGRL